jgi:hypothetical protein
MMEQNLTFAIGLALIGGVFQVISVLILAYPEHIQKTKDKQFPCKTILLPLNILFQLINGVVNTGATIFGPVSIVMPIMVSSQLFFNMVIFGYLQMEEFGKDVQVGTFIVVLGAVFLPIVGPTLQQDQEIMELLSAPWSLAWTSFLFAGVVLSGISCLTCVNTKKWEAESIPVYVTLTVARVFSSVLSASLSKTFVLVSGFQLIAVIGGFLICSMILMLSIVLQATKTEQKLFVPIISCGTQLVNAATGLVLWEDWKVVQSWVGYPAVMIQIVVGVYLISSLDFFENTADTNYSIRQSLMLSSINKSNNDFREDGAFKSMKGLIGGISIQELRETADDGEIEVTRNNVVKFADKDKFEEDSADC